MAAITNILQTDLNGLKLKNPIMTASGTYGYNDEYDEIINVAELGAVITKAITLNPRQGNKHTRITETKAGMINSIGLENVGAEMFIKEKLPVLKSKNIDFIVNIGGSTMEEYVKVAKIMNDNGVKAVELNVSCPNVKSGCIEFGVDEELLYELVCRVRDEYNGYMAVKLTPNVTSIEKLAQAVQKAGANAVSAINTLKGSSIKVACHNGRIEKTTVTGGYSGIGIKPVAIGAVIRLAEAIDIPIIGIGGIETTEDVIEFIAAGADAVQIGTANFTHPDTAQKLINGLSEYITSNGFKDFEELKKELRK